MDQWITHGCTVQIVGQEHFEIEAENWSPNWLRPICVKGSPTDPFESVFKDQSRNPTNHRVPSDPAIRGSFGIREYLSSAQAETIRAVMLSPADAVRVIVLPTGGGKSLVGLTAALLGPSESGVSIFIVPTIALAHDQVIAAKRFQSGVAIDAWESGLSVDLRNALRSRIRSGTQRLLYVAPEALVGGLASDLIDAARKGMIRAFVIDEAHLVGQWGASFRPEYQSMGAFWQYLVSQCPDGQRFRTLLMTATLTSSTFDDLSNFFGPLGPEHTVASVHLREEADYYQSPCSTKEEQVSRVTEILRNGPRPAILYVTKQEDAHKWYTRCLEAGWLRTGLVHGNTTSGDREKVIRAWRENQLDLVVATSAFGLGMDKSDVRLVVHACVPETVDRYYQEVGRGGRDGLPCVSSMIWTPKDRDTGKSMSKTRIVGQKKGLQRWQSMWASRKPMEDDTYIVDLNKVRPGLDWEGESNLKWNLRTLLLLARANILNLKHYRIPPLDPTPGESEQVFASRYKSYLKERSAYRVVEMQGINNPLDASAWNDVVETSRQESRLESQVNWRRMDEILKGTRSLRQILAEVYTVPKCGIYSVADEQNYAIRTSPIAVPNDVSPSLKDALIGQASLPVISYRVEDTRTTGRLVVDTLLRLASLGIKEFALPGEWPDLPYWFQIAKNPLERIVTNSNEGFIIVRKVDDFESPLQGNLDVPRVSVLGSEFSGRCLRSDLLLMRRSLHLLIAPNGTLDPGNFRRTIESGPHLRLESFFSLLNQ